MKRDFAYIVLGLGGIGSGALYWLARQAGGDVLGLEQFEIGHVRGGSQDHSRIIRLSYHTPGYVELAKAAYGAWTAVETDLGQSLIVKTGGLDLFPADAAIPSRDYTASMDAGGVPYDWLSAAEVMARWPQFRLTDDVRALFQAESGIAPAAKCNAAHLKLAQQYGAVVKDGVGATAVTTQGNTIVVKTGGETYHCHKLIVANGAWTNHTLVQFGRKLPLTVTQEQVVYYNTPHAAEFMPDRFPIWIWMDEPSFYGFPVYGEAGPKAAQDVGGDVVTAESRSFEPNPAVQQRVDDFVQRILPHAYGPPILTKTCLYTLTPDRDFVIDTLPENPNVIVAVGAGHAFKFASVIGRILSQLATQGTTDQDISAFGINRDILLAENPATHFLV